MSERPDVAATGVGRDSFANVDENEANFAVLYEMALGLSDEQCPETEASDNWPSADAKSGLLARFEPGGLRAAMNLGSGAGERRFTGIDQNINFNPNAIEARYGSSMGRFMSSDREIRLRPSPPQGSEHQPAAVDERVRKERNAEQPADSDDRLVPPSSSTEVLNKNQLSEWMDAHALSRSSHHCAMYCRLGMEAAGMSTADRPQSGDAGDYGPFLLRHGAQTVAQNSYVPQVGDVVVFDKTGQHPNGHIEMYDGHHWVSDFMQHGFSPYRDASSTPSFTIYRLG